MLRTRALLVVLPLAAIFGCGGGGGSTGLTPSDPWPKFRHDLSNSGQGSGPVESNTASVKSLAVDSPESPTLSAVSASPAIALDGSVYIGSDDGTLLAVDRQLNLKWRKTGCEADGCDQNACPGPGLGRLIASPAVHTQNDRATVVAASTNGCLFVFQDNITTASCTACFRPQRLDTAIVSASFSSSPGLTAHPITLNVTGIFIGASIQRTGSASTEGKLYAVNIDGSLKWEFPGINGVAPMVGPISSSPAFGAGSTLHFTTDDGILYAVTNDGSYIWRYPDLRSLPSKTGAGTDTGASAAFAPSPLTTADAIFANTASNGIVAVTPDGDPRWHVSIPNEEFAASLAIGNQAVVTPTPIPPDVPTPTPTPEPNMTGTPTITPTPLLAESTLFGITKSGKLIVMDAATGSIIPPSGPLPTPATVLSSPALSSDGFLVFGSENGTLYVINTATGLSHPNFPPLALTAGQAIRSSPAIASDGTIYVGADDGKLYAVGLQ